MDLTKWLVDTTAIEAQLAAAQAQNDHVRGVAANLLSANLSEAAIAAALDTQYGGAPECAAARVRERVSAGTRTPRAQVAADAQVVFDALNGGTATAEQLDSALACGPVRLRSALAKLKRDGKAKCDGRGRGSLWRAL